MAINSLKFGEKVIGDSKPCFIIAEIGQNHQGDINIAKKLIDVAKDSGADCVKFQKTCLEEKFTKSVLESNYSSPHSWGQTYGEHKKYLEFSTEQYLQLQKYAKIKDILFTASIMDPVSLKFLSSIRVPFIKIGSGDCDNISLLEEAAKTKIPLIISTGMQDDDGMRMIYDTISSVHKDFTLLHCVSGYPTPYQEANLRAIPTMKGLFPDIPIGYSGHEEGYAITLAAVALGAKVVERHITLDKTWKGNDHKCSLEPQELKEMIRAIREVEGALGDGIKSVMPCEKLCQAKLGKCLVSARDLEKGKVLNEEDVKVKVAQEENKIAPRHFYDVMGKTLKCQIKKDQPIRKSDFY